MKGAWTAPVEVATGVQPDGTRLPCWNPVLFEMSDSSLALFYKVGPDPRNWWGMVRMSTDGGQTWGDARRLPEGILGPVKNKPVRLADGTIISPSSTESNDKPSLWRIHFERSTDAGRTWTIVRPGVVPGGPELHAIQPSILTYPGGRLQAVGRTRSGQSFETWSDGRRQDVDDAGADDSAEFERRDRRGHAADGRQLLVYNHTPKGRTPLNVAHLPRRQDLGRGARARKRTRRVFVPGGDQGADGRVHITYTWKRQRVRHVVVDPARLQVSADGSMARGRQKGLE